MTDIQLNAQSLVTTSATTAPSAGTSESWSVTALGSGFPALTSGRTTFVLADATATASTAQQAELVRVTACTGSGATTITVTRGVDGTTPVAHTNPSTWNVVLSAFTVNTTTSAAPSYAPERLGGRYDNARGIYNFKASNTRILDQGRADAMTGGITRHLIIGNSVSAGATSGIGVVTYDRLHAWPLMMRDQLANMGIPANGTGFVRINDAQNFDARWVTVAPTGTWTATSNVYSVCSTVSGTVTFIPDRGGTVLEIGYRDDGGATVTVAIDGATSGANFGTFSTTAGTLATAGAKKFRMTGCTIRPGSVIKLTVTVIGTGFELSGAAVWTPNAGLQIDNVAQSGSYSATTTTPSANWSDTTTAGPMQAFKDVSSRGRQVTDAATTAGVNTLTSATAAFTVNDIGEPIQQFPTTSGVMFPPNTYIIGRTSATVVTMSNNALASLTAQTVKISKDPNCVHIALGGNDTIGGAVTMAQVKTAITGIVALFPNSDIILHLENEPSRTLASTTQEAAQQTAFYELADALDVPLYDWRDRAGTYEIAFANGIMQDYQAHMIPGMYADLGSSLAQALGGGSGKPQAYGVPTTDGDLTNKLYVDGKSYGSVPVTSPALTTTDTFITGRTVPANWLVAGSIYKVTIVANLSAAGTPSFRLRFGILGTTGDTALITHAPVLAAAGSMFIEMVFVARTTGAAGTSGVTASNTTLGLVPTTTNSVLTTATPAINTTLANILSVSASATAGTLTIHSCLIEQV